MLIHIQALPPCIQNPVKKLAVTHADMGARLATFTANPFSIVFPESVANSFCVSIMIEIFCCCWIYYINRKQTWLKTTRPTRLDEILPVLLFPNEFKDILFPLMVSMPSDSSRIFCRALSVASREFVYTIFGINKLFAARREGRSYGVLCRSKRWYKRTSSATRASGDER